MFKAFLWCHQHVSEMCHFPPPNREQIGQSDRDFYKRMPFEFGYFFLKQLMPPLLSSRASISCVCSLCVSTRQAVENITSPLMRHSLVTSQWWLNSSWASLSARRRSCPVPSGSLCQLYPVRSQRCTLLIKWEGGGVTSSKCHLSLFINLCHHVFIGVPHCHCECSEKLRPSCQCFVDKGIKITGLMKSNGKTNVQRSTM